MWGMIGVGAFRTRRQKSFQAPIFGAVEVGIVWSMKQLSRRSLAFEAKIAVGKSKSRLDRLGHSRTFQ